MVMQDFFERYAAVSLHGQPAELAALYGSGYVIAGPKGAYGGLNDESFLGWLEAVQKGNSMTALRPARVSAPHAVGPNHSLVTVDWAATFGEKEVEFTIAYLLENEGPRIIGYVSYEDEAERKEQEGLAA